MTAKVEYVSAHAFQRNGFYERLAQMRADDPRTFASISPASKLALFEYEKQLRQHEQEKEFSK
jgi:hypothetical protein